MKLLFVGDVIGKPGRRALQALLPRLVDRHRADYAVVNVENSAGGFGVTPDVLREIEDLPIDVCTTGGHVRHEKDVLYMRERITKPHPPAYHADRHPDT